MSYPRETVEFQPVTITVDGVTVTEDVEFCVVPFSDRPVTWAAPYVLGDEIGILISGMTRGNYSVYAKVTDAPEAPVINCGSFRVD